MPEKKLRPHPRIHYETYFNDQIFTKIVKLPIQKHYRDLKKNLIHKNIQNKGYNKLI